MEHPNRARHKIIVIWMMKKLMNADDFKSIRQSLGLSVNQMADALGVHGRIIRYYETGERPVSGAVRKLLEYILAYGIKGQPK